MRHPSPLVARLRAPAGQHPSRGVLAELRRAVISGDAPPGSAIPLREVAEAFGVSPIPVREALQVLVGEGLVVHRAHAGYAVARLSRSELAELYVVRGALEEAALRAAAPRATDDDVDQAHEALAALRACLTDGDVRSYHEHSRAFHVALMAPAGMPRLLGMVEQAWNLTEAVQPMRWSTWQARERLHAEHAQMLEAFAGRDADALVAVARAHQRRLGDVVADVPLDEEPG
ncbi:GntR family transcriptional regulator [Quadrisphaera setariae]|uniref:GntR family transcriptional regulator n=1 Tax=Quadrisphaera setariae TaxID=2593304 RepID=A0A5C8Z443_9ACTN|nr:GntR family transcriptional regulator [Quadrisphaera setariae]TXR52337.1 GntR family transcriptional regulator [Quadrisphaera setariae]